MSDEAPRLLLREQGDLDAVAARLRAGRRVFAICVCAEALRPAALSRLRERSGAAIPDPVRLGSAEETLERLTALSKEGPGVIASLEIDAEAVDVLRTINWHREKLARGGSAILWLDDIDGLRALRAWAPDAYSFRDSLILLQGEPSFAVREPEGETPEITLRRLQLKGAQTPEERAEAALWLVDAMRQHGARDAAGRIAKEVLAEIHVDENPSERMGVIRVGLYHLLGVIDHELGRLTQAWRWIGRGLSDAMQVGPVDGSALRLTLLALMRTPLGAAHQAAEDALDHLASAFAPVGAADLVLAAVASSARQRGDFRRASKIIDSLLAMPRAPFTSAGIMQEMAQILLDTGEISIAVEQCNAAASVLAEASISPSGPALGLATCEQARGELRAAEAILQQVLGGSDTELDWFNHFGAARLLSAIQIDKGCVAEGLAQLRALVLRAARLGRDGYLYHAAEALVTLVQRAHEAGRLSEADRHQALAIVATAEDVALAIAAEDPPWYTILYPALRGELFALQPDSLDVALSLLTTALTRARAAWTEAAPMHARKLVQHLIRAGRLGEARAALTIAIPEAEAEEHLKELAALQAFHIVVLARTNAAPSDIASALDELRSTFDASGGRRITAETLGLLAVALPPDAGLPEPLSLLDEAHALFLEMPMPAREARCLEAMGDVLVARDRPADAQRRYLLARGLYEQYDLALRLPLLTSKLAGLPQAR